ncbi:MAG: tRNA epoxyqueuosine(34) reductase QueG [Bacteroidales bacterium]|nr:tRNA epoxyqueuosine(34) reductase QueG [Bacteroidales bacterium]
MKKNTKLIKSKAIDLGFSSCGISKATFLKEEVIRFEKWLKNNMHGKMYYMQNHFDKRLDPRLLLDNAKSVISLLYNYYPNEIISSDNNYIISKYAYGQDYHIIIKEKLKHLIQFINKEIGNVNARTFTDTAPLLEKVWAAKCGLGWIGKNTCLVNKKNGSFSFISEIIIDIELEYNQPIENYCGTCTKCIDACPTGAIVKPFIIDANKCISYLTIEYKGDLPTELKDKFNNRIFGCDICQDVCPWNKFAKPNNEPGFKPNEKLKKMKKDDWVKLDETEFNKIFKNSAVKRTGYKGLMRNIHFLS